MKEKRVLALHFSAQIEEVLDAPPQSCWHAQFMFYPLGYFRGRGRCPGRALIAAWKEFRREVDPGKRWWAMVQGPVPPTCRY